MSSGSSLTSKLHDKIIKMLSKSHETIPLRLENGHIITFCADKYRYEDTIFRFESRFRTVF
jgi:hypothetical protein